MDQEKADEPSTDVPRDSELEGPRMLPIVVLILLQNPHEFIVFPFFRREQDRHAVQLPKQVDGESVTPCRTETEPGTQVRNVVSPHPSRTD